MSRVKIGIVGVGNIGTAHAFSIYNGEIDGLELSALCDISEKRRSELEKDFSGVKIFSCYEDMIRSGEIDAIIISTPHYFHPVIAYDAFNNGLHVLSEKPIGVYTENMDKLFEAQQRSGKCFCVMFNQRTNKLFKEAKRIVDNGEIGEIKRSLWIVTNWYRTQAYYDSGDWRATWQGEGGGVLLNQAPHNLDLWQWICGMPKSIYAVCKEASGHHIEVEDDATIFAEYENGASGVFITSTCDYAGTNRFEITGTKGKLVLEKEKLTVTRLSCDDREFCIGKSDAPSETEQIILDEEYNGHRNILQNFANAIIRGEKLISPAKEAMNELLISNAAYLSSWKNKKIDIPFDEVEYKSILSEKIQKSSFHKNINEENITDKKYSSRWKTKW
ncbi:MAG: Gfo/Idh/MocA family oxidoreductase [Clostridia bacterium]|nr:Gfo/Idh/MocA family oxidoreductase [Clostridia bacterium]